MPINCIIVDTEPSAIDMLDIFIKRTATLNLIAHETDPLAASHKIQSGHLKPDLAFIEIQMHQLSGIKMAEMIYPFCNTIFATSNRDYAVEAFDNGAIDYLVKPISYERFMRAIQRFRAIQNLRETPSSPLIQNECFYVYNGKRGSAIRVYSKDLLYIESANHNCIFHFPRGEKKILTAVLSDIEEQLNTEKFQRAQRSFIVNMDHVEKIEGNFLYLMGHPTKPIVCGKEYKKQIKNYIWDRMLKTKQTKYWSL
jgi:DNA-binding LytR/AlgR family response regulator